jgi:tetratricopeptide (TPR) repeat protein
MIVWNEAENYEALLRKSVEINKPILLDLYSENCRGCRSLETDVYGDPKVAELINEYALPLRIFTDKPDRANTNIINNHIYIWSPTVQLLASDGTRYHEWYGAPRQTRYSVNYEQTHHEVDGNLKPQSFLGQFYIGLGKAAIREKSFEKAEKYLSKVLKDNPDEKITVKEATFWLEVAKNKGKFVRSSQCENYMTMFESSKVTERFISSAVKLRDKDLMTDWPGQSSEGDWNWYTDSLKEVFLQTYQMFQDFNLEVQAEREKLGSRQTIAQRILADFHQSYREFQSSLIGISDEELDLMPFKGERSLRENLVHCILSEWWAHSPQIRYAINLKKKGKKPQLMPGTDTLEKHGEPVGTHETLSELLSRYEFLHNKLIIEFSSITEDEFNAYSKWWEPDAVQVSFRLKRLGWHLRDHRVSLEKIIQAIGHKRTEIEIFCQLLYSGLAKAEGSLIGMPEGFMQDQMSILNNFIRKKTGELKSFS